MVSSRRWIALVSAGCETKERSDARVKFSVSVTAGSSGSGRGSTGISVAGGGDVLSRVPRSP